MPMPGAYARTPRSRGDSGRDSGAGCGDRDPSPIRIPGAGAERVGGLLDRPALSDLEAIGDFIAQDDLRAAERWIDQFLATALHAARNPLAGRLVPEVGRNDVREVFKRTYRIVYRVSRGRVEVLTVFEGHRLFPGDVDVPAESP